MTQHQPNPSALRSLGSRGLPVPAYLSAHYWWAYVHPNAVQVFERQWLVNLILWGNYPRLSTAALGALGSPIRGSVLQIACAYGDITPRMVGQLDADASLDVVDILPVQLSNLAAKLEPDDRVHLHCMNSAALKFDSASFDQVVLFFLLHEQPADVRLDTVREAARVLRPGGRLLIVDYSNPVWFHPLRYLWKPVLKVLEPFARDLLDHGIEPWVPAALPLALKTQRRFFGGLYQMLSFERSS